MRKVPICLIIDDSAPRVHLYCFHVQNMFSTSGIPLLKDIPNDFLEEFCDLSDKEFLKGKFSIVPMAGCIGDILHGFKGYPDHEIQTWLDVVKRRLTGKYSFCPEMLTHHKAVNLTDGGFYDCNEMEWASSANQKQLTDYIEAAINMLRSAGFRSTGVTSPWSFGIEHENEYAEAIADAVYNVWKEPLSWYCLRSKIGIPGAKPWVQYNNGINRCVSIPNTAGDVFWSTMDVPEQEVNHTYLSSLADLILTEDGKSGSVADALSINAIPTIYTHWQSLFSNGSRAGIHALELAVSRINHHFSDMIEWTDCETLAKQA